MSNPAKPLILSVDDDQDTLMLIERFLTGRGYSVITADKASEALLQLNEAKPDLILLDVEMPEMDGYEFCAKLQEKKEFAFIPVVFLTSLGSGQDKARAWAFASGTVDYVTKPTRKEKLIAVVNKHLRTKKRWDELQKELVSIDNQKLHPDFTKFKEFLFDRLDLPPTKKKKLSDITFSNIYSVSHDVGIASGHIARLIAEFLSLTYTPFIDPEDIQLGILPTPFCKKNLVVPLNDYIAKYAFVLSNPFNYRLLDILKKYSGRDEEFRLILTERENIFELLLRYSLATPVKKDTIVEDKVKIVQLPKEKVEEFSESEIEKYPAVYIANHILDKAVSKKAGDIHIKPKETNTVVRFCIEGNMSDILTLQKNTGSMLIERFKAIGGLDTAEKRKSQDGAFKAIINDITFKLRLATTSTPQGESLIIRLLELGAKPKDLKELGMTHKQVNTMIDFANRSQGFILIVGPTGSGKTTTIYSLLSQIDCRTRSLISVEDSIEYLIPFANQQEVNDKAGVTFKSLLKSSVSQDPDILFISEVKDQFSAKIAVDFARTDHLTISTMHTSNATTVIFRLLRLGVNLGTIADAVIGIAAQRLLKRLCQYCKKIVPISMEEIEMLRPFTDEIPSQVAHPLGCLKCNNTGYLGREGIYEVIKFDSEISERVRSDTPISEIRNFVRKRGDYLMSDHAVEKVKKLLFYPKDVYEKVLVEDGKFDEKRPSEISQQITVTEGKIGDKMSILIVEDDKDTQKLIARFLETQDYKVTIAEDGIEALLYLGKKDFDLIISDINMPNLDGLKLLEMKNQKGIETPVILLTAQTSEEAELKGLELGAADYLKKPIHKEILLLRVKRILEK